MPLRARNKLVLDHLHIVGTVTSSVAARITQISRDDLASAGAFALVRAADSFDASLGVPFGAFAHGRVRWALLDELRSMDWAPRDVRTRAKQTTKVRETLTATLGRVPTVAEIAQAMGVDAATAREGLADAARLITSIDTPELHQIAWNGHLPEERAISAERDELLHRAIAALPERKARIVRAIYFDERSVTDVARELGVSHAAVSQQRSEAMRMLRDALARHYSDDASAGAVILSRKPTASLGDSFDMAAGDGRRLAGSLVA